MLVPSVAQSALDLGMKDSLELSLSWQVLLHAMLMYDKLHACPPTEQSSTKVHQLPVDVICCSGSPASCMPTQMSCMSY